jgi:hypothetical protein
MRWNSSDDAKPTEQDYVARIVRDDGRANLGFLLPLLISAITATVVSVICVWLIKVFRLNHKFIAWYDEKFPKRPEEEDDWRVREELRKKGLVPHPG